MDLLFLDLWWVEGLIGLVLGGFALWVIPNKIWAKLMSFLGATLVPVLNKVDSVSDGAAAIARGAGFEKLADVLDAIGDSADEIEDPLRLLDEYTKDGKLDEAELKTIIDEIGEGAVSVKVLVQTILSVIKKKPE